MADQDRRYIYPAKGRTVRDPAMSMQPLPETGQEVIWSLEWQQSLHFGDITIETDAQKAARIEREEKTRKAAEQARQEAEKAAEQERRETERAAREQARQDRESAAKEKAADGSDKKG